MVAVTATATIGATTHSARRDVPAVDYDTDGGRTRAHARILARADLTDVIADAHPDMSIRDASDYAIYKSEITTERYTTDQEDQPF